MAKIHYVAVFSDGKVITRQSDRLYTHAWRIQWETDMRDVEVWKNWKSKGQIVPNDTTGFSGSAELARKAAAQVQPGKYTLNHRSEIVPTRALTSDQARIFKRTGVLPE